MWTDVALASTKDLLLQAISAAAWLTAFSLPYPSPTSGLRSALASLNLATVVGYSISRGVVTRLTMMCMLERNCSLVLSRSFQTARTRRRLLQSHAAILSPVAGGTWSRHILGMSQ
jgi:hypothetical protein